MSDYKLVPVEPTVEMVEAAKDAYIQFGDMDMAIRAALLAAHDVQGEQPVPALATKPRLTGANGSEFEFVLKWDGSDAHPYFEIINGAFDMTGEIQIADLLIAVSDWISEYAESIRTPPTRTGINEYSYVRMKQ